MAGRWLVISDLQIPFEAQGALAFCTHLAKWLGVPLNEPDIRKGGVICVGDELDHYHGSDYDHDPDALHTPNDEIMESREKLRQWQAAFPRVWVARSNHGERWDKKQAKAGIPREFRVKYQRVMRIGRGWRYADKWLVRSRFPWQVIHGLGYSSQYAYRTIPLDQGVSTAFGHLHSHAGVAHIITDPNDARAPGNRWGMNTGCLIDPRAYAFKYGADSKFKVVNSVGAVVDDGLSPLIFRYEGF